MRCCVIWGFVYIEDEEMFSGSVSDVDRWIGGWMDGEDWFDADR